MTFKEQIMKLQTYKMYEDEDTVYVERKDILKLLEQQPCEDVEVIQVSKGALKSRQGRFVIYDVEWLKKHFYLEENLYGQPKQPCEDCISREEVRQLICKNNDKYGYSERFHEFTEECLQLPPVTPQQKVGKWIKTYEPNDAEPCILWMCSKCQNAERRKRSNYCPNCGAKMVESQESKENII